MSAAGPPSQDILDDMTAFAMSSTSLRQRAMALAVGERLSFVPREVLDGSPVQQAVADRLSASFAIRRIALSDLPEAYGLTEADLAPGTAAFLVSSDASPQTHQLAVIAPSAQSDA